MDGREKTAFSRLNPIASAIFFTFVLLATIFLGNPFSVAISLAGGLCFYFILAGCKKFFKDLKFYFLFFVLISLSNPIFSHAGATPLFFMNGNAVTKESILYGVNLAATVIATIFWCKCFNAVMTADKLMYLFNGATPKISLVLSSSLRLLPLLKRKWNEIKETQIAIGYYSEKGFVSKIKCALQVFSALATFAIENSVDTASSMLAKGYGLKNRTAYRLIKFGRKDAVFILITLVLLLATLFGLIFGNVEFSFYPIFSELDFSVGFVLVYCAFAFVCFFPTLLELKEIFLWKFLKSKI